MDRIIKAIVILLFIITSNSVYGQKEHGYNFYAQFLGPSTGFGYGIDSRFKSGGIVGYSAGIGFINLSCDDGPRGIGAYTEVDSKGLSIPFEINAIFGKRASKFEVGLGFTTYLINRDESHGWCTSIGGRGNGSYGYSCESYQRTVFRPNIMGTISIGYRLQRRSGFFMKIGLSVLMGDFKCSPIDGVVPLPNICLGYTIPHF